MFRRNMVLPFSDYKYFHKIFMNRTLFAWKYEFINSIVNTEFVSILSRTVTKKLINCGLREDIRSTCKITEGLKYVMWSLK
jgi:hypothetical protein